MGDCFLTIAVGLFWKFCTALTSGSLSFSISRKTLSIETLSPLMAALSGEFFINENLTTKSWVGIIIVTISLFIILRKGSDFKEENSSFSEKNNFKIYDLRNLYTAEDMKRNRIKYFSIGRPETNWVQI